MKDLLVCITMLIGFILLIGVPLFLAWLITRPLVRWIRKRDLQKQAREELYKEQYKQKLIRDIYHESQSQQQKK